MSEVINQYFNSFFHPFQTQALLRERRELLKEQKSQQIFHLVDEKEERPEEDLGLSFVEVLSVTWLFSLFRAFYAIVTIYLGYEAFLWANGEDSYLLPMQISTSKLNVFFLVLQIVFFPLALWIYSKFWVNIIKLFANLFGYENDVEEISNEIVNNSLTAHTFLIIPIFGEVIQHLGGLVYIFAGLRRNLQMSVLQSVVVLISPLILFLFLIFFMFISLAMIFMSF